MSLMITVPNNRYFCDLFTSHTSWFEEFNLKIRKHFFKLKVIHPPLILGKVIIHRDSHRHVDIKQMMLHIEEGWWTHVDCGFWWLSQKRFFCMFDFSPTLENELVCT